LTVNEVQERVSNVLLPKSWRWHFDAPINTVLFSDGGRNLTLGLGDGTIRTTATETPSTNMEAIGVHKGAVLCIREDTDQRCIISGGDDGRLLCTSLDRGAVREIFAAPGLAIDTVAVGGGLTAAAFGREVGLFDSAGREVGRAAEHPSTVTGLAFNSKAKRLGVSHYNGVTLWWTNALGRSPKHLKWRGSHIAISWSPNGDYIMTATQESELHGWRLSDGADLRMTGYAKKVRSFSWISKGKFLATDGTDRVIVWPFAGKGPMGKAPAEIGPADDILVRATAAHPARPLVAAGYDDGSAFISDIGGLQTLCIKPADGSRISQLTWSPDGTKIAITNDVREAFLYDLSRPASA